MVYSSNSNGWEDILELAEYKVQEGIELTETELRVYQMYHNGYGCSACG